MVLSVVVLDSEENFLHYLNPELLQISESNEQYGLRTINTEYYVQGIADYKNLFRIGNKLFVSGVADSEDCMYIINTPVENDLFDKNNVVFDAEEKLVELNYVYFSQRDLISKGFTLNSKNAFTVNYDSLKKLFGSYFSIGIIQKCLSDYMEKIVLSGSMSLMEVLRYIEEETGNVFIARYEKDVLTNKVHCYLNFLNPKSTNKQWELHLFYKFPEDTLDTNTPIVDESNDILEEDDKVVFDDYEYETPLNPSVLKLRFRYENNILFEKDAIAAGFTDEKSVNEFVFDGTVNNVKLTINNDSVHAVDIPLNIKNGTVFEMFDTEKQRVVYAYTLHPRLFDVHEEILDLGFNVENINYDVDESDTFMAIAPKLQSDNLSYDELGDVLDRWVNLRVCKGQVVPMIVQKRTITGTEEEPCITIDDAYKILDPNSDGCVVSKNYFIRPVNPNDQETKPTDESPRPNNSFEFLVGTAYWAAPFTKMDGELFVADDNTTGIEYTHVLGNLDDVDADSVILTQKTGPVETSDEDPYAIFNDVCMALKDKRYPEINVEVDVANLSDGQFNNYNIFDKVYVKIPGFEKLITASVNKTVKNLLNIGENKVELTNYNVNKKVAQKKTDLGSVESLSFMYPSSGTLTARLVNLEYDPEDSNSIEYIPNEVVTFTIYSTDNGSQTLTDNIYVKQTDENGYASVNVNLLPGHYVAEIQFGSDMEYAACTTSVIIVVGGEIEVEEVKKTTTIYDTQKVKRYYTKYGVSPNKDHDKLCAIGRTSTGDKKKDAKFYVTLFKRKCPICGSTQLFWSIFWAGDENKSVGTFPGTGKKEKGSHKGRIFCKKCGNGWNALGESLDNKKKLTVVKKSSATTKAKAYELRDGNKVYDTVVKQVKLEKVLGNDKDYMSRDEHNTGSLYSGLVANKIVTQAKNLVGNSTGLAAAKKIAKWVGKNIRNETRYGLYQSPSTTLNRKIGNDLCQVDLFFQMCDSVGVTENYSLEYIQVGTAKPKIHYFAKINGTYVDVCSNPKNPWKHATKSGKSVSKTSTYPKLPDGVNRKY